MGKTNTDQANPASLVKTRDDFPKLLRQLELTGKAAEIGVAEGYFSWHLLDNWPGTLWMIDPWRILDEPGFTGHGEATDSEQEARFQRILAKSRTYKGGRAFVLRATSVAAAVVARSYRAMFDFVYIDANHTLIAARQDIALWWPRVNAGGVLAGHDYLDGVLDTGDYGVRTAVNEFAAANNLQVNLTQEKEYPSWWVRKP